MTITIHKAEKADIVARWDRLSSNGKGMRWDYLLLLSHASLEGVNVESGCAFQTLLADIEMRGKFLAWNILMNSKF